MNNTVPGRDWQIRNKPLDFNSEEFENYPSSPNRIQQGRQAFVLTSPS